MKWTYEEVESTAVNIARRSTPSAGFVGSTFSLTGLQEERVFRSLGISSERARDEIDLNAVYRAADAAWARAGRAPKDMLGVLTELVRSASRNSCEFAKTFGFHNWVDGDAGRRTCHHCRGAFVEGDILVESPQALRAQPRWLNEPLLREHAQMVAEEMSAEDLRVLFIRAAAREHKEIWVDLWEACSAPDSLRAFQRWARQYKIEIEGSRAEWLREVGCRRVMSIAWSPTYHCAGCEGGEHRIGVHWHEAAAAYGQNALPPERRLDAVHVRTWGLGIPYRRPRAAEIAVEALIRRTFHGQPWNGIRHDFSTRGQGRSLEALKQLALRAALDLGFSIAPPGRPKKKKG